MIFIILLILSTLAVAGSAAFFSVVGLAATFSGTFWSVVVMGGSLEAAKLVAASYLYRYWKKTGFLLKTYLIAGVIALMVLTSTGIFGYLSVGYQLDSLPLKQTQQQISVLEEERIRLIQRKKQIDDQIQSGAIVQNIQRGDRIDPNAVRALRETTRARASTFKQFNLEQKQVTARISDIDGQLLTLKQQQIKTEAHIGPITYIAKAFDLDTDNATKYLIFLIIFAFDPMAVALTLAVNVALRLRKEELESKKITPTPIIEPIPEPIVQAPIIEQPVPVVEPPEPVEPPAPTIEPTTPEFAPVSRRIRPYAGNATDESRKQGWITRYTDLQTRKTNGATLSQDEVWEMEAIARVFEANQWKLT